MGFSVYLYKGQGAQLSLFAKALPLGELARSA